MLNFLISKKRNKRGESIIAENLVFIILNLVFIAILIGFIVLKAGDAAVMEEKYAKQIALMIDSAKPGMKIQMNMADAINKAKSEDRDLNQIVKINGNTVVVDLRGKGGYSYSFFNDVEVNTFPIENEGSYAIVILGYNENVNEVEESGEEVLNENTQ